MGVIVVSVGLVPVPGAPMIVVAGFAVIVPVPMAVLVAVTLPAAADWPVQTV